MKIDLTEAMTDAAYEAYDNTDGHTAALLAAVRAALELVPEPGEVVVSASTIDRAAALERAQAMTDHLADPPMKSNGYVKDGWKAPSLEERTTAVLRLAAFLTGSAGEV